MKIVQFIGGLGNQMFQYAFYLSLKNRFPNVKADLMAYDEYKLHNGYELEAVFNVKLDQLSKTEASFFLENDRRWLIRKLRKIFKLRIPLFYERREFKYDKYIVEDPSSLYYIGYWQCSAYFHQYREELLSNFTYRRTLNESSRELSKIIEHSNSISVHVRRGDYINNALLGGICDVAYYETARTTIETMVPDPVYIVFSNDIAWCKRNLRLKNVFFSDGNSGSDSAADLHLMSLCKHNIIANSSFSWWGAWLNRNEQKIVIAPKKWVNSEDAELLDVVPDSWIRI